MLMLPTVVSYARMLARLAIGLDKQPQLIAHLTKQSTDEGGARETLPERAANIMRQAFVTCLNDRSGDASGLKDGKPDGKKAGIYKIANLCLKVLFQCRKIRNAEQMFVNIDNQAPPLSAYPRGERVTYLYYLGRFHFACNHFWRAQLSLQTAYDECHKTSLKQRRLILLYLIAASITMGRFPSANLLHRPEATGFAEALLPICDSIRKGDLAGYRRIMDLPSNIYAQWLLHFRVYLQLRNRCEVLVWRSLFRKTFQLTGFIPAADSQKAATLSFQDVLRVEQALLGAEPSTGDQLDADLDGADGDNNSYDSKVPSEMLEIESKASSLVVQGLLNGFLSHRQLKFAITGAKRSTALIAGFPNVYQTISGRHGTDVPGWVRKRAPAGGAFGPGRVVNLSGIARPAGSAPT